MDGDGALTSDGRAHRQGIEDRTDALAVGPLAAVGDDGAARLRDIVRPWSRALVESGEFGFRPPKA
ncbi:MAG: hypothetical protein H0W70_11530 [Actinobacteria bacterium]|nr:hypothetical protein [Actinomycetota bacterium]